MMKSDGKGNLQDSKDEAELSALMIQSQNGNASSYRALLTRIEKMARSYIQRSLFKSGQFSDQNVEDICQEVLLAVHTKRHTYDPDQFFLPWFFAIARYKLIDYLRRTKKSKDELIFDDEFDSTFFYEGQDSKMNAFSSHDVTAALELLPEKQKKILKLVRIDGLTTEEAAVRTGFTESDIKVSVHRALKTLRKKFGREN